MRAPLPPLLLEPSAAHQRVLEAVQKRAHVRKSWALSAGSGGREYASPSVPSRFAKRK